MRHSVTAHCADTQSVQCHQIGRLCTCDSASRSLQAAHTTCKVLTRRRSYTFSGSGAKHIQSNSHWALTFNLRGIAFIDNTKNKMRRRRRTCRNSIQVGIVSPAHQRTRRHTAFQCLRAERRYKARCPSSTGVTTLSMPERQEIIMAQEAPAGPQP